MSLNDNITVVTVCDNHYTVMLAALVKSIELTHKTPEKIDLYIVDDKINSRNKEKLQTTADSSSIKLHWIKMSEVIPSTATLPLDRSSFPLNIYTRLFIPHFVPSHIQKVVYLDVDTIFMDDISKLFATELGDKILGAVIDKSETIGNDWAGISNYKSLGLSPELRYFNSGVLLLNAPGWRAENITNKIIQCIKDNLKFVDFPDQYGLNVVFAGNWLELDPLWNTQSVADVKNPYLIHFTGTKPIYKSYSNNETYKDLFYKYLGLTEWHDYQPASEYKRLFKRLINKFGKRIRVIKSGF